MNDAFLWQIFAPGIVAALVSYSLGRKAEANRTQRDYVASYIDDAREEVRRLTLLAVRYHSRIEPDTRRGQEAEITMYEADLRARLADIRLDNETAHSVLVNQLRSAEADFISAITGGEFGSETTEADQRQASKVVGAGTLLRAKMRELRVQRLESENPGALASQALLIGAVVFLVFWLGTAMGSAE